ncbi:MAG: hypothetical protein A2Z02_01710 [Chloroflexi bacterium RBG_16_48_7]|nr:MAG: hypothetical protein A2Z02_01710 [Chloroflexi bacterium RBG_16_48_7]
MMERIQYRALLRECQDKLFKKGETVTAEELGMYSLVRPEIKVGYWWGTWKLGSRNALLCYDPNGKFDNPIYWIDLENMNSSAQILDKIFDTVSKNWVTADVLANLLWALEDIFDPQRNICAGGADLTFDAETHLTNLSDNSN